MAEVAGNTEQTLLAAIRQNAGLTIAAGVVLLIAGMIAIATPLVAGLSITIMVGAMLALSGVSQCFLAFKAGAFGRALMVFVVGVLMLLAGIYMMQQPVSGLRQSSTIICIFWRPAFGWAGCLCSCWPYHSLVGPFPAGCGER